MLTSPTPETQSEFDRIAQLPGAARKSVPGVPDKAFLKAADLATEFPCDADDIDSPSVTISWTEDRYKQKQTIVSVNGKNTLSVPNNTIALAELLAFWAKHHVSESNVPVVCLID